MDVSKSDKTDTGKERPDGVKRRNRKREKYVPSSEPLELPFCRICGKRASGIHFGVYSCEACKVLDILLIRCSFCKKLFVLYLLQIYYLLTASSGLKSFERLIFILTLCSFIFLDFMNICYRISKINEDLSVSIWGVVHVHVLGNGLTCI